MRFEPGTWGEAIIAGVKFFLYVIAAPLAGVFLAVVAFKRVIGS